MGGYILRRVAWAIVVVLAVTLVSFAVFYLLPSGDPALRFAGRAPSAAQIERVREELGLDRPWYVQYGLYVRHLVAGDEYGWPGLGYSYDSRLPVKDELAERLPRTLSLVVGAAVLWLVLGVAVGVVAAVRRGTLVDRLAMGFALFGVSAPAFWLGLLALFVFWEKLGWLPGTGYVSFSDDPAGWIGHLILPWLVLAFLYAAFYARITRSGLLEVLGEDYIRTARAKGLPERRVIGRHALRAALTPIVTMFGLDVALLVGGAVIIESVFNLQGVGSFAVQATLNSDLPAVAGVVVVASLAVALASLAIDLLYGVLDPRVRTR